MFVNVKLIYRPLYILRVVVLSSDYNQILYPAGYVQVTFMEAAQVPGSQKVARISFYPCAECCFGHLRSVPVALCDTPAGNPYFAYITRLREPACLRIYNYDILPQGGRTASGHCLG
mgnify:CR=1 FL=1